MIVDDQADIRGLIRLLIELASGDLEVSCEAGSGREALALLDACDPNVIVLDEMMPGMNGIEVATHIAARRPGQHVIMCSAYLDDEVLDRARRAGVTAFVHKDEIRRIPDVIRDLSVA
jgi:DNA-binding NarL/FixJ family response regulator